MEQIPYFHAFAVDSRVFDGAEGKIINVIKRDDCPNAGKPFPTADAENGEKGGG